MRLSGGMFVLVLFALLAGCSGSNKAVMDNYINNYSFEVDGITETATSVDLPTGITVNAVSNTIHDDVVIALSKEGLTKNDNKYRYRIKYRISYFGHKWTSFMTINYIMRYNVQLIDVNSGAVIAAENTDSDDTDVGRLIEGVAAKIVEFALRNIK